MLWRIIMISIRRRAAIWIGEGVWVKPFTLLYCGREVEVEEYSIIFEP